VRRGRRDLDLGALGTANTNSDRRAATEEAPASLARELDDNLGSVATLACLDDGLRDRRARGVVVAKRDELDLGWRLRARVDAHVTRPERDPDPDLARCLEGRHASLRYERRVAAGMRSPSRTRRIPASCATCLSWRRSGSGQGRSTWPKSVG